MRAKRATKCLKQLLAFWRRDFISNPQIFSTYIKLSSHLHDVSKDVNFCSSQGDFRSNFSQNFFFSSEEKLIESTLSSSLSSFARLRTAKDDGQSLTKKTEKIQSIFCKYSKAKLSFFIVLSNVQTVAGAAATLQFSVGQWWFEPTPFLVTVCWSFSCSRANHGKTVSMGFYNSFENQGTKGR